MEAFREVLLQLVKKNRWLFLILIATLLVGTFGYTIFGKGQYSLLDCLYMTVITITTIGYGENVDVIRSGKVIGLESLTYQNKITIPSGEPRKRIFVDKIVFSTYFEVNFSDS